VKIENLRTHEELLHSDTFETSDTFNTISKHDIMQKKNPLKNMQVQLRLNPFAATFSKEKLGQKKIEILDSPSCRSRHISEVGGAPMAGQKP
jgi:hypothetical protein